jgi:glycosyltransferase involved in cell wall biosynthesis
MPPLVSILIPAYNAAPWIGETIESALRQTWPRKEIIVADDGSTDGTLAAARRYASKNVRVLTQANQGAAAARNLALAASQGDFLQWLDADDLLAPDKIEKQMQVWEAAPDPRVLLSGAWGTFYYRARRTRFKTSSLWCDLDPVDWMIRKFQHNHFMQTGTWLVTRDLTQAAGPWDTRLSYDDDGEYFSRVIRSCRHVRFVPASRVMYRAAGSNSLSRIAVSDRKLDSFFLSTKLHVDYLLSLEDSPRVREACATFLQGSLLFFYPQRPDLVDQVGKLAGQVGATLKTPRLPWKYAWIQSLLGWQAAKQAYFGYNDRKVQLLRCWDRLMFQLEPRQPAGPPSFPA